MMTRMATKKGRRIQRKKNRTVMRPSRSNHGKATVTKRHHRFHQHLTGRCRWQTCLTQQPFRLLQNRIEEWATITHRLSQLKRKAINRTSLQLQGWLRCKRTLIVARARLWICLSLLTILPGKATESTRQLSTRDENLTPIFTRANPLVQLLSQLGLLRARLNRIWARQLLKTAIDGLRARRHGREHNRRRLNSIPGLNRVPREPLRPHKSSIGLLLCNMRLRGPARGKATGVRVELPSMTGEQCLLPRTGALPWQTQARRRTRLDGTVTAIPMQTLLCQTIFRINHICSKMATTEEALLFTLDVGTAIPLSLTQVPCQRPRPPPPIRLCPPQTNGLGVAPRPTVVNGPSAMPALAKHRQTPTEVAQEASMGKKSEARTARTAATLSTARRATTSQV